MKKKPYFLLILLTFLQPCWSDIPSFLTHDSDIICINDDSQGHYQSRIEIRYLENHEIMIHTYSDYYDFLSYQDQDLQVRLYEARYNHDYYRELSGLKFYRVERLDNGLYQIVRTNLRNRTIREEKEMTALGDFNQIKILLPLDFFQNGGIVPELKIQLYDPNRDLEFHIKGESFLIPLNQLQERYPQYSFPEHWNELLGQNKEVIVTEFKLAGFASLFYNHPFIYCMDQDYRMLLEWGAAPDKSYYTRYDYTLDSLSR